MEKINVLPQTFYQFECDENLIAKILPLVKEEGYKKTELRDGSLWKLSKNYTSNSYNTTLHKQKEYAELIDWIYKCINEFKEDLKLQCEKFTITQCWSNCAEYGKQHHEHVHPNSFLSGILYLNNTDAKTTFVGNNIWNYFYKNDSNIRVTDPLNILHREDCVAGKLILFPSNIVHMVPENSSTSNRYTISFNAFPSGQIGDMNALYGLNIDIL